MKGRGKGGGGAENGGRENRPRPAAPSDDAAAVTRPTFEEAGQARAQPSTPLVAAALGGDTLVTEQFRLLRARVRGINETRPFRCFGIGSAASGEGKTSVAVALAAALGQEPGRRVLLLEADLRKPSVDAYLGLARTPGLVEWLEGKGASVSVRRVLPGGFFLLSAGVAALQNPEVLGSARMAGLLEAARQSFDTVVVDCPPILPVADAVVLQDLVDGLLVVVRARHTPRETVLKGLSMLKPDRVQGLVFNDHHEILTRYYSYGYGYGRYTEGS
ncbi:MAG TPA: CpsD/CapB family tyrosine-protein kinase [Vicinamibacteria bacterium]